LGRLNPPPQLLEFKHSNGKDRPNLKDPRKAGIEQIHFKKLTHTQKNTHTTWNYKIPRRNCRFAASSGLAGAAMAAAPERRA
jgi:hypothetical protein